MNWNWNNKRRYGNDNFNYLLLVLALIFAFVKDSWIASLILIAMALFRALSTNITRRQQEAYIINSFLAKWSRKIKNAFNKVRYANKVVFICPNCGQKLSVPKGKGTVRITCKRCGKTFEGRT